MGKFRYLIASALVSTIALATPGFAQTTGVVPPQADTSTVPVSADGSPVTEDTEIVVTGSRIRRSGFDTLEPATVVSGQYLEARALTNVADALNEIPGFGVGVTPEGGQSGFGVGQNFVNRFGLGSARTLTLVNGRRFVSTNAPSIFGNTPGLQVDLNVIPADLVDRIENIAIGGAPTYGSDAIAGTVNVILKQNFSGVRMSLTSGVTERGDNGRYNGTLVAGKNFAEGRGNITIAGSYDQSNGVLGSARQRLRDSIITGTNPTVGSATALIPGRTPATDGRINPNIPFNGVTSTGAINNADGVPSTVYIRDGRIYTLTAGGLLFPGTGAISLANSLPRGFGANGNTRLQFDPSGNLVNFNPGIPFGGQNASGGDGFRLNDTTQLTSGLERITGNFLANYHLTDHIRAFVEGEYYRAKARELADQSIYNATLFGGSSAPLLFQANDPRLTPSARAQLAALGVTNFRLSRASTDLVNNNASSTTDVYRAVAGFDGDFSLFNRKFNFEATANYGRSEGSFFASVLNQQHFVNAINVTTNSAGQIVCNTAVTAATKVNPDALLPVADAACVPLNVFGSGAPTAAAKAYVTGTTRARSVLEQQVYNANFGSSDLLDLYGAGSISFNIGYEHRREYGGFFPDDFQKAGLGRSVPIGGNSGSFHTNEVFGEVLLPIIGPKNEIPFLERFELDGKVRYVNNSVNGGFTTYTYGGRLQPIRDITFRGNYTRSLRAPSITELFTPVSPAFNTFNDPCDNSQTAVGSSPAIRAANCAAFYQSYGLNPATFVSQARLATVPITSGGNTSLKNEEARSYTFGVVLEPRFIPRLRVAVDWNRINISGPIASLTPANIAEGCYDNPSFNTADVDNANAFCSLIRRDRSSDPARNGQLSIDNTRPALLTNFVNGAYIQFKGLTAEAQYNLNVDVLGGTRVDLGANLFYLESLRQSNNGVTVTRLDGTLGNPHYAGQGNLGLTNGPFGLDFQANYTGPARISTTTVQTVETNDIISVSDQWIFNLTGSVRIDKDTIFRAVVSNLTNEMPPYPLGTAAFGVYDLLGRRFSVSIRHTF